jgi:hypothetical protein
MNSHCEGCVDWLRRWHCTVGTAALVGCEDAIKRLRQMRIGWCAMIYGTTTTLVCSELFS